MNQAITILEANLMPAEVDQVRTAAEQVECVEFLNPSFDPLVTIAVVRFEDTGALRISDSRPEEDWAFDAEFGKARALYTALLHKGRRNVLA